MGKVREVHGPVSKHKKEKGARCSMPGVGETSAGGIMIMGGTISTTDSTMYLKKISM